MVRETSPLCLKLFNSSTTLQRRVTEKSMFIKRQGEQRVSCRVDIMVKSIRTEEAVVADLRGPYAIQILRGPLRSETEQFSLAEGPSIARIDLLFQRETSIYQIANGTY